MDSKKALMAVVTVLGVIASAYLFLQGKIAFEEYSHWKSREAVLEKEIEQLRKEAKHHREFLDRLRRDPDYQDAVARKELGTETQGKTVSLSQNQCKQRIKPRNWR